MHVVRSKASKVTMQLRMYLTMFQSHYAIVHASYYVQHTHSMEKDIFLRGAQPQTRQNYRQSEVSLHPTNQPIMAEAVGK